MRYFVILTQAFSILILWNPLQQVQAAEALSLETAYHELRAKNPEIAATRARAEGESSLVWSAVSPDNPKLGLMREKNLSGEGIMDSFTVSQELQFPAKYFLMGSLQNSKARAAAETASATFLQVRQKFLTNYYSLWSVQKIAELLQAQKESLRQVAQIAGTRHATGGVPQQDEMKAHMELARLESDLLMIEEEQESLRAELNGMLNRASDSAFELPKDIVPTPVFREEAVSKNSPQSKTVKIADAMKDQASTQQWLAAFNFAPDFELGFRRAFKGAPDSNYAISLDMKIPLWFLTKQIPEFQSASHFEYEAEKNYEKALRETETQMASLKAKVKTRIRALDLYEKALIPQATSTLRSSRASYQAGRIIFSELLDSERTVYGIQIAYYRALSDFVANLSKLEEVTATSLSNLPFGENL